jgi:hypothetical protein
MSNKGGKLKRRLEGLSSPPHEIHKSHPPKLAFGDQVKVRATPEANAAGVAGMAGEVIGFTKRSGASVAVVGSHHDDYAFHVSFKEQPGTLWFTEDQLELVAHSATAGAGKSGSGNADSTEGKKPAWKFW